jgi:hypothetical protein
MDPLNFAVRVAVWRFVRRARGFLQRFRIRHDVRSSDATLSAEPPSNQTAVDIFKGTWTSAFPAEYRVQAGGVASFEDARVRWAAGVLPGGFRELTILELGPYEGYAAWQFERLGARSVTAIEANDLSYLKSLVAKEVTGVGARVLYGDFDRYLDSCAERFDLVWASGVLYHSTDPLGLIRRIARVTDAVFVHTHYYLEESATKSAHRFSFFEPARDRVVPIGTRSATLHYKAYGQLKWRDFVGGAAEYAYWLEKEDLFAALRDAGFDDIQLGTDDPGNPNGPALFLLARRTR